MNDQENLADDLETEILRARLELTHMVRATAHRTWEAYVNGGEGVTRQLADLAYAFACLEGARRGVLPGAPPPPPKNGAPAAIPPSRPTSSSEPASGFSSPGDTSRRYR